MNKIVLFVFLFINQLLYASEVKKFLYHEQVFYVEVPSSFVSFYCTKVNPDGFSIGWLVVELDDSIHELSVRRAWPIEDCKWRKKNIETILKHNEKVRVMAVNGYKINDYEPEIDYFGNKPPSLKKRKSYWWYFDRIDDGGKACFGYFEQSCSEKNLKDYESRKGKSLWLAEYYPSQNWLMQ